VLLLTFYRWQAREAWFPESLSGFFVRFRFFAVVRFVGTGRVAYRVGGSVSFNTRHSPSHAT
jgi:hypothetical protein